MTIINITKPKGANGTSGIAPTNGANGLDSTFTQNGQITADSLTVTVAAGEGGDGGNGMAVPGANGGKGGNTSITVNGNIFNGAVGTTLSVDLHGNGGAGGLLGTGTPNGLMGNGGNSNVTANGNVLQPNKIMTLIELKARAHAGDGNVKGNATATLNGNIIQNSKLTDAVILKAEAFTHGADAVGNNGNLNFGTKTATLNGNIVQGNMTNITVSADAYYSNGTANINGNIIQSTSTNTGNTVNVEATGNHIFITNNKVTLNKQGLVLTVNELAGYDATIKDNEFKGTGTNAFTFTDNANPGPHFDTVAINLAAGTFVFNSMNNVITGFNNITVNGTGVNATLTGSSGDDILNGGDGDDIIDGGGGNDKIYGGKGNDILTGGEGNDELHGNDGDDTLDGGNGDDLLFGGAGDDTLIVSAGVDVLDGMTDPLGDTASFINATAVGMTTTGVTVDLTSPGQHDYSANGLGLTTLLNIQNVTGSNFDDTLVGDAQNNTLTGGNGNDTLRGNGGNDTLVGGSGGDTAIYSGNYLTDYAVVVNNMGNGTVSDIRLGTPDGADTLTSIEFIQFSDGTFNTATQTFVPNGPPNTAPVLNPLATPVLATEAEDPGAPGIGSGTLVSSLVDSSLVLGGLDNVTDPDPGAQLGIALTATDTTNGTWLYSTNGGTSWSAVGAVTNSAALLLAADPNTRLFFQPNTNFNGSVPGAITFRAWDKTSGSNGGTADTSINGGTTAFSTVTDTADINITAVNDAPVATITPLSYLATEQVALSLKNNGLAISDVDAGAGSVTATLSVVEGTLNVTAGTSGALVVGSGTNSVTLTGTLAQINALLNTDGTSTVSYIDNTDTPSASTTLSLSVNDNGNTGTGGALIGNDSATINITAVNDAPVATITPLSYLATEQVALSLKNNGLAISDVDAGAGSVTATLSVVEGTLNVTAGTSGALVVGSGTNSVTLTGTLAQINALLNTDGTSTVSYIDNTDTPSASTTLSLSVNDNGNTGTGGALIGNDSATINITAVNDAPVATITPLSYLATEQVALSLKNNGLAISDVDAGAGSVTATLSVVEGTLNVTAGTSGALVVGSGTNSVTLTGTLAQINALLNTDGTSTVSYIDNTDTPSASTTLSLSVNDNGNTGTGGALIGNDSATINITAVNDAPVLDFTKSPALAAELANAPVPVGVVGTLVSDLVDYASPSGQVDNVTDPDGLGLGIALTATDSSNGSWWYSIDNGSNWIAVGAVTDATALLLAADPNTRLYFQPTLNFNGSVPTAITFRAWDLTSGSNGGTADTSVNGGSTAFSTATDDASLFVNGGENYFGTPLDDNHTGTAFDDIMHVSASTTFDVLDGAAHINGDTLMFDTVDAGVTATINSPVSYTVGGFAGTTNSSNFENLTGSNFDDVLTGDVNANILDGGDGDDVLVATVGGDTLTGGANNAGGDTADFSGAPTGGITGDLVAGNASGIDFGTVNLVTIENLTGTGFDDSLIGDGGNNVLSGGGGDDTLLGGMGDDTLDGGAGINNTADYSDASTDGLVVDLNIGASSGGGLGDDIVFNIQNLTGSAFKDTLIGDDGDNTLIGGLGNDILYAHLGSNTMNGDDPSQMIPGGTDVAYYAGLENDPLNPFSVLGGPGLFSISDFNTTISDTLINVERVKFLAPSHVSDFDNDGDAELVYQNGSAITIDGATTTFVPAATTNVVGTGQFDPDSGRNANVLLQESNGNLSVLLDAAAVAPLAFSGAALNAGNYGVNWKALATGDFNGDASWDVLLQNQATKAVEIFTVKAEAGDPIGYVNSVDAVTGPAGANWKPVAAGDFNGDGKSDIVWQNSATKAVEVTLMNGATVINAPLVQPATNLTAVGTGDFNADGLSDILFRNSGGNAVIWYMLGDAHVGTQTVTKPTASSAVAGAADVDGNGYSDIIWTDAGAGTSSASLMGGPASLVASTVMFNGAPLAPQGIGFHLIATGGG